MLALLVLVPQDEKKDLKEACAKMDKASSYHFAIKVALDGEEKLSVEGEYLAPSFLHTRTDRTESARNGATRLVKAKDGEWKEPGPLARRADDPPLPHEWVRRAVEHVPALKKEKSAKIGSVTVDLYVHSLSHEAARKAFEAGGLPLLGSAVDWSKTQNGLVYWVGRDDLVYRVEQRLDGRARDDQKIDKRVVLEFSEFGKAKCRLPEDVREKLGMKGDGR